MLPPSISRHIFCSLAFFVLHHVRADCIGDTLNYNSSGIFVPFKNLCGRDINITSDFVTRHVPDRLDCLSLCVSQATLCYGFDFNEAPRPGSINNCYLQGGVFEERDTIPEATGNAAMLLPEFRDEYLNKCGTRGLQECLQDQLAAPTSGSPVNASTSQGSPAQGFRLSTGARVGIGSAIAVVVSLSIVVAGLVLLRCRKIKLSTESNIDQSQSLDSDKSAGLPDVEANHELGEQCTQEMGPADAQELGEPVIQELEVVGAHELRIHESQELEAVETGELEAVSTLGGETANIHDPVAVDTSHIGQYARVGSM